MCLPGDVEEELDLGVGCQVRELWWVSELQVRSLSEGDAGFDAEKIDIIRISLGTFKLKHIRQVFTFVSYSSIRSTHTSNWLHQIINRLFDGSTYPQIKDVSF